MSCVISNERIAPGLAKITIGARLDARPGQFCMLRAWGGYPLLSRPFAVYDETDEGVVFVIQDVGLGSGMMTRLKPGDEVETGAPRGRAFPDETGRVALVAGGTGIVPLHFAASRLSSLGATVDAYLGFSDQSILTDDFERHCRSVSIDVGGFITDRVDAAGYDCVYACGPEPMQRAMHDKCEASGVRLFVSLESRMACGIGVCLGCSRPVGGVNARICREGPVFESSEVFAS